MLRSRFPESSLIGECCDRVAQRRTQPPNAQSPSASLPAPRRRSQGRRHVLPWVTRRRAVWGRRSGARTRRSFANREPSNVKIHRPVATSVGVALVEVNGTSPRAARLPAILGPRSCVEASAACRVFLSPAKRSQPCHELRARVFAPHPSGQSTQRLLKGSTFPRLPVPTINGSDPPKV